MAEVKVGEVLVDVWDEVVVVIVCESKTLRGRDGTTLYDALVLSSDRSFPSPGDMLTLNPAQPFRPFGSDPT